MKKPESYESYAEIKVRLDEIVSAVSDDSLPLDQALGLYEEAVKLGLRVSSLIEQEDSSDNDSEESQTPVASDAAEGTSESAPAAPASSAEPAEGSSH